MIRYVVLTVDYEIFGNGAGDVGQHMTDPTERMARLCEKYESPLTIFVEMEETLAFERHAGELQRGLGYNPYELVRRQVIDLVRRGHDAQLHLHPQWYHSQRVNGEWRLDETKATVDSLFESVEETTHYLAQRTAALQEMVSAGHSRQCVNVYRAGAFSAQPGSKLIAALATNNFKIDSSVVHGLRRQDENVCLDYTKAPAGRSLWRIATDVAVEQRDGPLWEVPIASRPGRRVQQLTWGRLKAKFSKNVPRAQQSRLVKQLGVRKNPVQFLKLLAQQVPLKFDFHNVAPRTLVQWIRNVSPPSAGALDVVVLIGHSKEHIDDAGFETLLRELKQDSNIRIASFADIAAMLPSCSGSTGRLACPSGRLRPLNG
jgi:hypothetical protein